MQFRNVSGESRHVAYGLPRPTTVGPDEVVNVPDEFSDNWNQPGVWEGVASPATEQPDKAEGSDA